MIIVLFFVCVPPLGWLGDIIIVFLYRYRACALFRFGVGVFNVFRGGVRFPNEVGVW